ncbi:hypothetical protein F2Q69_00035249 [Brassica cretica]|uniref:Uncharacterized protein n=1 Tax=Brassica cretica TaxID=69181 RepID=A0A8S9ST13_BRACR|nr:hypothetical protein F2Q69_00035249 [Brassica cretica]
MLLGLEPCRSCGSLEVPCKRTLQLANGLSASSRRELNTLSNAQKMSHHPDSCSPANSNHHVANNRLVSYCCEDLR